METTFLDNLYKGTTGYVYLWTPQKKLSYQFLTSQTAEMMDKAAALTAQHMDVYYSLGVTQKALKTIRVRAKQEEIYQLGTFWADIDIADASSHAKENLPPDIPAALSLIPENLPPSIVVSSGHGIHVYWLLDQPVTVTDQNRQEVIETARKVQQLIRNTATERGWHIDPVADLSRILRVPGTYNYKNTPVRCEVIDAAYDLRYDYDILANLAVTVPKKTEKRDTSFEHRDTDGDAKYMLSNCRFLQHCQLDAASISYDEWLAMLTNVARASDGVQACHELSQIDSARYDQQKIQAKIDEALTHMAPTTCAYIQQTLHFNGCDDCQVKCPSSWSLAAIPKAKAIVRDIAMPTAETVFTPEVVGSLALLAEKNSMEYAKFKDRCKGHLNLNDLSKAVAQERRSHMHVLPKDHAVVGDNARNVTTQTLLPDCPIDLIVPPGFSFSLGGIEQVQMTEANGEKRFLASGSPIVLTARIFNVDTDQEKIELCFKYYNQWRRVVQARSTVFNSRSIIKLADYGLDVTSESSKYLVKYLQALSHVNMQGIPLQYSVSRLGWRNHETEFVLPQRTPYRIELDDDGDITSAYTESGTLEGWLQMASEVRKYPYARLVLAAGFAAPLLRISPHRRNFMLYFWGTSGGGKTAAIKFALSPWGLPDQLMASFLTTKNGLERKLQLSSDFPVGINERQVAGGGRDKQEQLEYITYMLEGGKGKGRASKTGLQRTASWRVIGIANGEEPLTKENSIQGVKNRVLEINTSPILPDALSRACHVSDQYGIAGPRFMDCVLQQKQSVGAVYNDISVYMGQHFWGYSEAHLSAVSLLATADYLVSLWLFGEESNQAMQEALGMAGEAMQALPTKDQLSDVARAWEFVENWISANAAKFIRNRDDHYTPPLLGFWKDDKLCIYPEGLTKAFEDNGFSPSKLLKEFALDGKIETEAEAASGKVRYRKRVRDLNGNLVRVIIIRHMSHEEPLF